MKSLKPLRPDPPPAEEAWPLADAEEESGFRVEIMRTQERLIATVPDRAALDRLSAHLVRQTGVRPVPRRGFELQAAKLAGAATRPLHIALALLIGAALGMLALSAIRFLTSRTSSLAPQMQEIELPAEEPVLKGPETKSPYAPRNRSVSPVEPRPRPRARAKPAVSDANVAQLDEAGPPAVAAEAHMSKQEALRRAYDSNEIQTWAEGGEGGFVLAGPLQRTGALNCRNMVQWRRGGEQGEARTVAICKDAEGKWVQ